MRRFPVELLALGPIAIAACLFSRAVDLVAARELVGGALLGALALAALHATGAVVRLALRLGYGPRLGEEKAR